LSPLLAALLGLLAAATAPPAEIYFEQATLTSTDGKPGGPGVHSRVWCSGKRMRLEAGDAPAGPAFLLRLDTGKAYRLDPEQKVAVVIDVERLRARSQLDLSMAGDLMGGAEDGRVRTAALATPKTIAGQPCHGYRITAPSVVMDLYVTEAIPVGVGAFADFLEWSGASQSLGALLTEIRQLPGFPMQTRSRITVLGRVHETSSTITRILIGPQPREQFEVPPGYRLVPETPAP
jgi:hypothetical protein